MAVAESLRLDQPAPGVRPAVVIDSFDRFAALKDEWKDLLRASACNNPFLTWEWVHAWWQHLSASRTLQIVTVRDARYRLIGVAPFCESRGRLPWVSQLEFLATESVGSDYLDVIARRGYERDCSEALVAWFQSHARTVRLDHVRPGAVSEMLSEQLVRLGWSRIEMASGICPFAVLRGHSWESYVATLRPSQQTRCRRSLNTLLKKFDVRFELVETEAQRQAALSALMGFHEQRWTSRGGSTAFQTPELRSFHHEVTSSALRSGWLRLFSLRLNADIAAVTYCFCVNGRFYLYQHGFNPQFCQYSVGAVILGRTIRAAIDEGASEFDMLYGEEPYKAVWASERRYLERIEIFPPHLRGRLHRRTVGAERSMRLLARRLFPRKPCDSNVPRAGVVS